MYITCGNRICIADQGPGITDKGKAVLPGFSSASKDMKKYIRGVGSGLPIANESLTLIGGNLTIEDNLKKGVVITLNMHCQEEQDDKENIRPNSSPRHYASEKKEREDYSYMEIEDEISQKREKTVEKDEIHGIDERMTPRQRKVFILIGEMGEAGPSTVAEELNLSLSTAYRDLVALEDEGLLECVEGGKRRLSRKGIKYLSSIFE
jgi:ribosomal protein S25